MSNAKLNGGVDMLAQAMRQVFQEGVENAVKPIHTEMKALRTDVRDMEGHVNERFDQMDSRLDHHQKTLDGLKKREAEPRKTSARAR